ncbi:MAG: type VI secretion system Vgr family protein [Duganella sp.]
MQSYQEFASLMAQTRELVASNRPLRLRLDLQGGINDDMLLPQRITGTETLCGGIEYRILCVSTDATLPLKRLIAVPAALEFVTDTGDLRSVCGIITEASAGDSDGGLASYQLVLRDALAILEKRTNTRVFRNMNEVEIVQRLLNEWRHKTPILGACLVHDTDQAFELAQYPRREFTMQHNESDAAFIRRLLSRRGIGWYIRAGGKQKTKVPMHTLVLFNIAENLRRNAAGTVRYHRDGATEERDAITSWTAMRTLQAGAVTRHSWNYRNPTVGDLMMAYARSSANQGVHGNELAASLDDYQIEMPHAGDNSDDLCRLGRLRMNRHDYDTKCFHGEGSVRDFCAGEYFTLACHPEVDQHPPAQREFVITALRVQAQNNLPKALAERVERLFTRSRWGQESNDALALREAADAVATGPLRMHVQFTAVRRGVKIVPAYDARTDLPPALMQSAIVVGPKGEEVHCDRLGRVKIRFPGTRPEDHAAASGVGASDTDADSAWVRVASNWAGNGPGSLDQCGTVALPRVGAEVLVNFLGGDPDRPVIVGQMYNQMAEPPALSEAGRLPGNRYLSGMRSREVRGERANQLRFDDTKGEISAQLASEHGRSELNLGFLTHPRVDGQATARGEGAELCSDKAVAVRGAKGVLISACRMPGKGDILLEREELISGAASVEQVAHQLSALTQQHADDPADGEQLSDLVGKIKNWHDSATRSTVANAEDPAIVAVNAPAGVFIGSQDALALSAQSAVDVLSTGDTRISTGGNLVLRTTRALSLFAFKMGIKLVAAGGGIRIQSQDGDIEITASKKIRLIANEAIELEAPGIKLVAQGCQVNYEGGAIAQQSKGPHTIKSSKFAHDVGGDGAPQELHFPSTEVKHDQRVLVTDLVTDEPLPDRKYRITVEDGNVFEGTTDQAGLTQKFITNVAFATYHLELLD